MYLWDDNTPKKPSVSWKSQLRTVWEFILDILKSI